VAKLKDDASLRQTVLLLLNHLESQHKEILELKKENQQLKDEINRLKGEKGKPVILANSKFPKDISSREYTKENKKWKKQAKKNIIKVDNEVYCPIEKYNLPSDAKFKGYETVIGQDIIFRRNTTKYFREVWYSATERKTYRSPLPKDYTGYFGNNLKAFCMVMHHAMDITRGKLISFLRSMGIEISDGSLQNILVQNNQQWIDERNDLLKAGLQGPYLQSDSTGARVNGHNHYTHVFVSEFFAVFATQPGKSRLDLLCALQGQPTEGLKLQYNQTTKGFLNHYKISEKDRQSIQQLFSHDNILLQRQFEQIAQAQMPHLVKKKQTYKWIIESLAFGYFFEQPFYPSPKVLLTDDAKEYCLLTKFHMLCWIHDARYYNKLMPVCEFHINELHTFKEKYWRFYKSLKDYKLNPSENLKDQVGCKFDEIFAPTYNYFDLNKQIKRTLSNKKQLLTVLDFPFIPLHNNASELAARKQVRKRDICLHTMTEMGTKLQDAFLSIIQTSLILGVDAYQYILDRINNCSQFYLPDLVTSKINEKQTL
jgi:hypothetical protein